MKTKTFSICLLLTSLSGYLEWGTNNSAFLFQAEWQVICKLFSDPLAAVHPLTLFPLIGQTLLVFTLFQRKPSRPFSFAGFLLLSILPVTIFFIGALSGNLRVFFSSFPFIVTGGLFVGQHFRQKPTSACQEKIPQ